MLEVRLKYYINVLRSETKIITFDLFNHINRSELFDALYKFVCVFL